MLICNGTINGVTYEEKQVNAKILMDHFGVPPMNGIPKIFRLIPGMGLLREDRSNPGETLITPGRAFGTAFTVTTDEGSLNIRFSTSRTPIPGGGGTYRYSPKKMNFIKSSATFSFPPERVEEYVWAYLHPKNKRSPFAKKPQYEYFDPAEDARKQMDEIRKIGELTQAIAIMPEAEMRLRAAGLTYIVGSRRVSFPGATKADQSVVRAKLIEALNLHKKSFIEAWNNAENSVVGVVMMAQSLNIIEQIAVPGGVAWQYTKEYGGTRICVASTNQNPIDVIVSEVTAQYSVYFNRFKAFIDQATHSNQVAPEITPRQPDAPETLTKDFLSAMDAEGFVNLCADREFIGFERTASAVYVLRSNGTLNRPILTVTTPKNWKSELVTYFSTEAGAESRDALITSILKRKE